jgi:probable rRNA maturation factor
VTQAAKKNSSTGLSLTVQYASSAQHMPTRAQFRRWMKVALQRDAQITLRIVGEAEGRELNRNYRGKDYATNVLTFVYDDAESVLQPL